MAEQPQAYTYRAEVQQLLPILSTALYTDRDIFVRELISNSSGAYARGTPDQRRGC
jgi:HSP90 family molecular chaperone